MGSVVLYVMGCLAAGLVGALAGGAVSGLQVGKEALGAEAAAYMGSMFGLMSGGAAVVVGLLIHFAI